MKKYVAGVVATLFCIGLPLLAQSPASADPPASRDDIVKLFDVMQVRQQMELVTEQLLQQMQGMGREEMKDHMPAVTPQQLAKADAVTNKIMKSISTSDMLDDMIPVYQKHLSKSDVDEMIKFYSTPTGQKILREMPAMTAEGMQAMQPRIHKQMDEITRQVDQLVKDEQAKPKTSQPAKLPAKKN
ncbi:MAG TPA: DUF2059 domain-containing protein [Candidatus Angelobacter sp.]|jgi:hypothetical protein